jgi:hypothetical protein
MISEEGGIIHCRSSERERERERERESERASEKKIIKKVKGSEGNTNEPVAFKGAVTCPTCVI